ITGTQPSSASVHLFPGWNLVGPCWGDKPVPTASPVLGVYGWDWPTNVRYVIPTSCVEGKGYWVAASQEGDVW
ncbi:MAG: hypothetical protein Q7I94_05415, partial [Candidatus Contubernalis sp.]|nr:hypothetical protein [Candidatus Contubernalis sp.]